MTHADMWTFQTRLTDQNPDVTGFSVEATDGHIGNIDEASYDVGASCLVVDTGWWIFGKKRMIPAGAIDAIDLEERKVYLRLTKDQIKEAPDYEATKRDDSEYRRRHDDYYARW